MAEHHATIPDPFASRAVLIGVSNYSSLDSIPASARNVTELAALLNAPDLWGLPRENCRTLINPESADEVLEAVHLAAAEAKDTLLIYFAGHGLKDERGDLFLALPDASKERLYKAISYDAIRREVMNSGNHTFGKIIILDCCYSGRALVGGMSGAVDMADQARVEGTFLMTATAETSLALAPVGETYTAFTGSLIKVLSDGLPDAPDVLGMQQLYWHIKADMQARQLPIPQQRSRNDGKDIALAKNRHGRGTGAQARRHHELPEIPAGYEAYMHASPQQIVDLLASHREGIAGQLLAGFASRLEDQVIASLLTILPTPPDVAAAIAAVIQRPAPEIQAIREALTNMDASALADSMFDAMATRSANEIAAVASILPDPGDTVDLLIRALKSRADVVDQVDIIAAAAVAGLQEALGRSMLTFGDLVPGDHVIALADELRQAGLEQVSLGLYAKATDDLASTRDGDDVAQLVKAMRERLQNEAAERLSGRAAEVWLERGHIAQFLHALQVAGLETDVQQVLTLAVQHLPPERIAETASALRQLGEHALALALVSRASLALPASGFVRLIADYKASGRPMDAYKLLDQAGNALAPSVLVEILGLVDLADAERICKGALGRHYHELSQLRDLAPASAIATFDRLLSQQPLESLAQFLHTVPPGDHKAFNWVIAANRSVNELAELYQLLAVQRQDGRCQQLAEAVAGQGNPHAMAEFTAELQAQGEPLSTSYPLTFLKQHPGELTALFDAFTELNLESLNSVLYPALLQLPPADFARLAAGLEGESNALWRRRLLKDAATPLSPGSARLMTQELHRLGATQIALEITRHFLSIHSRDDQQNLIRLLKNNQLGQYVPAAITGQVTGSSQ